MKIIFGKHFKSVLLLIDTNSQRELIIHKSYPFGISPAPHQEGEKETPGTLYGSLLLSGYRICLAPMGMGIFVFLSHSSELRVLIL